MHIFLIGYRGSGKSSVAPLLGQRMGLPIIDTDNEVEATAQITIAEIFARQGEAEFRRLETEVIRRLVASNQPTIVSLGGGAPTVAANRELMAEAGKTIYLRAKVDTLWRRISNDQKSKTQRPSLTDKQGRAEVEAVLKARTSIYTACADWQIDVDTITPEEVTQQIVDWLEP